MADYFFKSLPGGVTGANSTDLGYSADAAPLGGDVSGALHSRGHARDGGADLAEAHGSPIGQRSSAHVDLAAHYLVNADGACPPLTNMIPGHGYRPIGVPPADILLLEAPERFPIVIRLAIYLLASTSAWVLLVLAVAALF